jgi:hypothetical protein
MLKSLRWWYRACVQWGLGFTLVLDRKLDVFMFEAFDVGIFLLAVI